MKITYFEDTDTALLEFTSERVAETREVSENIYLDLDENGNLVSMTIEHARESANIRGFCLRASTQSERITRVAGRLPLVADGRPKWADSRRGTLTSLGLSSGPQFRLELFVSVQVCGRWPYYFSRSL